VQHILEKLHMETRTAAGIWWYEDQLQAKRSSRAGRKLPRG
jgi:hypothetical protein